MTQPMIITAATTLFLLVVPAAASIGDPCTQNWRPRDPTNEFNCTLQEIQPWLIHNGIAWSMPLIVSFLFAVIIVPIVCVGRYCCDLCGSSRPRPGHCCCGGEEYDRMPEEEVNSRYTTYDISCAKIFMVILIFFGILASGTSVAGSNKLFDGFNDVINAIRSAAQWIDTTGDQVTAILSGGNQTTALPTEFAGFAEAEKNATDSINQWKDKITANDYVKFVKDGFMGLGYTTLVPLLMYIAGAIIAYGNLKTCAPMGCITLTCFLLPLFGICGTIGVYSNAAMGILKTEVEAQSSRSAGVFQDYFYPRCVKENPVMTMSASINATARTLTTEGCQLLTSVCSTSAAYDPAFPKLTFRCLQDPATSCNTLDDLINLATRAVPKSGGDNPETCGATCSFLLDCPTSCALWEDRNASSRLGRGVTLQTRAETAYETVLAPYADCNVLIDHILSYLPLRGALPLGLQMLTAAFGVTIILLMLFTVGLFRGQKRFIEPMSNRGVYGLFSDTTALNPQGPASKQTMMEYTT